jgi:hypothetical protein
MCSLSLQIVDSSSPAPMERAASDWRIFWALGSVNAKYDKAVTNDTTAGREV